jgi:hypothetical protein
MPVITNTAMLRPIVSHRIRASLADIGTTGAAGAVSRAPPVAAHPFSLPVSRSCARNHSAAEFDVSAQACRDGPIRESNWLATRLARRFWGQRLSKQQV